MVTARRAGMADMLQQESKKEQFLRHVATLNKSFFTWFADLTKDKDTSKDSIDFIDGFQVNNKQNIANRLLFFLTAIISCNDFCRTHSMLFFLFILF
jgi:hypothetical protein